MGGRLEEAQPHLVPSCNTAERMEVCAEASALTRPERASASDAAPGIWEVPVYFALVTPQPGAHTELLSLLQREIVAPLTSRRILSEFRVLTCTPPSFVAEASTLIVFELVVPCPWPVTDWDVQQWQRRLGSKVRLVVAPSQTPRRADSWDTRRARSVLTRAMVLPPAKKIRPPKQCPSWISACVDRGDATIPVSHILEAKPYLSVIDESSGRRARIIHGGATLMSEAVAIELSQHLPVSLRWQTAWRLVYSPRIHGVSLNTFYRRMENEGPSLLLIQDHCGCVFGGFASAPWHVADRYFGSGESFVFRFGRRLPKPMLPLSQQIRLTTDSAGTRSAAASQGVPAARVGDNPREEEVMRMIRHAVKVLSEWHPRNRAEVERAGRAAAAAGCVTSPTEALDELLGIDSSYSHFKPDGWDHATHEAAGAEAESPSGDARGSADDSGLCPSSTMSYTDGGSERGEEDGGDLDLEVFHWSSKDPFFLFSDMECVAMGGGSAFALYLEKDLLHGMSEPCSTFGSKRLSSIENFIIGDMECWVFDDPSEVEAQAEMAGRPPRV